MAHKKVRFASVPLVCLLAFLGCSTTPERNDVQVPTDIRALDLAADRFDLHDVSTTAETTEGLDLTMDHNRPEDTLDPADTLDDVTPEVLWQPPFDPTVCGSAPHEWLPPTGMGTVVLSQEEAMSNVAPETIDQILAQAGYDKFDKAKYPVRNFKIRYTTQDRGVLTEATAVLGVPMGEEVPWPAPMLLWLHGTTGYMDDCAPSKDMIMGSGATSLWAAQGYVTVAPDYMGMRGFGEKSPPGTIHSYLVGEATAISCLDALRAAQDFLANNPDLNATPDPDRVVMIGGSQGGHAAFFTELYAPHYAPELTFLGVAAAVPLVNLAGQATFAMTELVPGSANLLSAMVAMKNWYGIPEDLSGLLTNQEPYFAADNLEGWLSGSCSPDVDPTDVDELSDVFLEPIIAAAASKQWDTIPPWGCFLKENSIPGTSVPRISNVPFLTSYAEQDELLVTAIEQEVWPVLCQLGYDMEYKECAGYGHSQGALAILPYAKQWLDDRVKGIPIDANKNCVMTPPVDCDALMETP
jgi:dienelactone hydrolase